MKNVRNFAGMLSLLFVLALGCKKDENKDFYEGGTAPVLSATKTELVLVKPEAANNAVVISWTNPNYIFTTGLNSQTVTYLLEIDTAGGNFSSPKLQSYQYSGDLKLQYTVKEFNGLLLKMELEENMPHNLEFRVTSYITSLKEPKLVSNVLAIKATPYNDDLPPVVVPPVSGALYIVGDATVGGWDNCVPDPSQKFTTIDATHYEIVVALNGGKSYKLLGTPCSWSPQYSVAVKNDPALIYGGTFKQDGEDALAPPDNASYKIEVDFQKGKFVVTKQ